MKLRPKSAKIANHPKGAQVPPFGPVVDLGIWEMNSPLNLLNKNLDVEKITPSLKDRYEVKYQFLTEKR